MLALKSYEQTNGFSVMDADELFFINGGSGTRVGGPSIPTPKLPGPIVPKFPCPC